jgi:MoxR-like ATPase
MGLNSMNIITLNNSKKVLASEPYRPRDGALAGFVGRLPELKMVTAAWIGGSRQPPLCPLLIGEPGVGKNRLVYELACRTGLDLYIFQGHEDVTAEDMACTVRFSDEPGRNMDYVASPLVTAMHQGGICFIDEIGKIRPRALALLASVLDERRYIDSTLLGERVLAHPRFRFVAATNTGEINLLPEFIRSRLRPVIEVGYPPREEINQIIARQAGNEPDREKLLQTFWDLFAGIKRPPSPRDAIHLFALAASLREYDRAEAKAALHGNGSDHRTLQPDTPATYLISTEHLGEAFRQLFKQEAK